VTPRGFTHVGNNPDARSAAAKLAARQSVLAAILCDACAKACDECNAACNKFPDDKHMAKCAKACRDCATACRDMIKNV